MTMIIYKNEFSDKSTANSAAIKGRGFVTIAIGAEKYYKMAHTLLLSYRNKSDSPIRFCVITNKENEYTNAFDDVIVVDDAKRSWEDKIDLLVNSPYDESIFIDADCIAYSDLNKYWDLFAGSSDMSAFGETLPLNGGGGFQM